MAYDQRARQALSGRRGEIDESILADIIILRDKR